MNTSTHNKCHINSHEHGHHHHTNDLQGKRLLYTTLLNLSITIVQIVGGVISNSLSLLSDALHNLGDSSAIFIAFLAGKRSKKLPDEKNTFGYKRIEILAALFNAVVLIAICLFLFFEAYKRFVHPEEIKGKLMLFIAIFGLLANLASVLILQKDKSHNLNVRAAYMHLWRYFIFCCCNFWRISHLAMENLLARSVYYRFGWYLHYLAYLRYCKRNR